MKDATLHLIKIAATYKIDTDWFQLGPILQEIANINNDKEFNEACKMLNFSARTGRYIIAAYKKLEAADVIKQPEGISWRKIGAIASIVTFYNREEVLEYCRTHTIEEIQKNGKKLFYG